MIHGRKSTYDRHRCRCDECKAANTAYQQDRRRWRALNEHLRECARKYAQEPSYRLKVDAERPTRDTRLQVRNYVLLGLPDTVIALRVGVAVDHVRKIRRESGMEPIKFDRDQWAEQLPGRGMTPPKHKETA